MAENKIQKVLNDSSSNYCKMPDGTLICYGTTTATTVVSANDPFKFAANAVSVNFPVAFSQTPCVVANVNDHGGYWNATAYNATTTGCQIGLGGNSDNSTKTIYWFAIGRWK